jgi:nitrite reductase/ring-hydroxylating ferredoxin subunit
MTFYEKCPHSSYPLSQGTPFDIEDFGIVFSAGLTCPKHEWSFDIFTGAADRGNYQLDIWEIQLREIDSLDSQQTEVGASELSRIADKEVWVRRRQPKR